MEPPSSLALHATPEALLARPSKSAQADLEPRASPPQGGRPPAARQSRFRGGKLGRPLRLLAVLGCASAVLLAGCATAFNPAAPTRPAVVGDAAADARFVIVAVAEGAAGRPATGAAARIDYRRAGSYSGSDRALDDLAAVVAAHGLAEVDAWTISALNWRCALLRLPAGASAEALLASLAADPRVTLAQPLNEFRTLAEPTTETRYNDPYLPLQTGFAAIDAAAAQRASRGEGVTVALIDTALDRNHPDLQRAGAAWPAGRDFVGGAAEGERHATEVAGVIAASANNGIGIVGVAPGARVLALRACWGGGAEGARCNSFTLAQALAAAIAAPADVVNLSLAGPRDPLLEKLVATALARGIVVVGAVPPGGARDRFPAAVPGVLAVAERESGATAPGVLAAPGRRILTLAPGGGYDYASGSSLAAAHVSGVAALLRALDGKASGEPLQALLAGSGLDACRAVQRLRPSLSCSPAR